MVSGTKPALRWIEDILHSKQQQVLLDGHSFSTAEVLSGVLQGTVLGPLLFLLFINDLSEFTKSVARLFADDCLLFCPVNSAEDSKTQQRDLAALEIWEKERQMVVNPEKCVTTGGFEVQTHPCRIRSTQPPFNT